MTGLRGSRLRMAALTGAIVPGLVLGAVGAFGTSGLQSAVAQTRVDDSACIAFGAPAAAPAAMSVADVAAKVNPAVVTVINYQSMSMSGLDGFSGMPEIPGFPEMPGSGQAPSIGDQPESGDNKSASQIDGQEEGDSVVPAGSGSGFIVDEAGTVVTNAHVVVGAQRLTVSFIDGTEVDTTLVGYDELIDVAVLKLELAPGQAVPGVVTFGDSSQLRPGDEVVAIGTALGEFPNTVSEGTVNGTERAFPGQYGLTMMIQHDAEIWHGNSGGPLLNLNGEVVGINTAGVGSGTMGLDVGSADMAFAVESNIVCSAAADLLDDGEIVWPYLGIQGQANADGQEVVDVSADGPSAAAGLQAGDLITGIDGQQVDRQHTLLDLLFAHAPGDVVTLAVERDGTLQTFQVTLGERPDITE